MLKTLEKLFREDPMLNGLRDELTEKSRPRRQEIAREHGFLVKDRSDVRCKWHPASGFSLVRSSTGGMKPFYICDACSEDLHQHDEEVVNFAAAAASCTYYCPTCKGFVVGEPIEHHITKEEAYSFIEADSIKIPQARHKLAADYTGGVEYICKICSKMIECNIYF